MLEYLPLLFKGALLSLEVAVVSLAIATVLGILFAFFKLSKSKKLQATGYIYSSITRGVPELVLMLTIYYGGQVAINNFLELIGLGHLRLDLSSFFVGTITIGFIYGAYMSETFRGAILAIEKGQVEAGQAFGFSRSTLFLRIIMPQMIRHGLASYTNNWLVLLKTISLVSLIGLNDVVHYSKLASGSTQKPFYFYILLSLFFLAATALSLYLLKKVEQRYHI